MNEKACVYPYAYIERRVVVVSVVQGEAARVNTQTLNTPCTLKVPESIARQGMHGFWAG